MKKIFLQNTIKFFKNLSYKIPKEFKNVSMKTEIPGPKSKENLEKLGKIQDTRSC
jgi:hypothetical protein